VTGELILIRHAAVAERYNGRCYGRSDVELSAAGERQSDDLIRLFATRPISRVFHSGLQRTQYLADRLANALGRNAECCDGLQERDFGNWELEPWDLIHRQFGDNLLRVITEPDTFRPGGGETTFEMRDRVLNWFHTLRPNELTVAVTHGGPIAVLRGAQQEAPVADWVNLIPAYGEFVSLRLPESSGRSNSKCHPRLLFKPEAPAKEPDGWRGVPSLAHQASMKATKKTLNDK